MDDKCVIVSADMEYVVRCLVKRNATSKVNYVVNEPGLVLDLDIMCECPAALLNWPKLRK